MSYAVAVSSHAAGPSSYEVVTREEVGDAENPCRHEQRCRVCGTVWFVEDDDGE